MASFLHIRNQIDNTYEISEDKMKAKKIKNIKGAAMVEYVLLIGLVGAASVLGLTAVGTSISTFFTNLSATIASAAAQV